MCSGAGRKQSRLPAWASEGDHHSSGRRAMKGKESGDRMSWLILQFKSHPVSEAFPSLSRRVYLPMLRDLKWLCEAQWPGGKLLTQEPDRSIWVWILTLPLPVSVNRGAEGVRGFPFLCLHVLSCRMGVTLL